MSPEVEGPAPPGDRSEDQAATKPLDTAIIPPDADTVPLQLRRRRQAGKRLPPLEHLGRSDPWEICPPSSREPFREFWHELKSRGLVTDAITAELLRLANELRKAA